MEYTNDKIKQLIAERNALIEKYNKILQHSHFYLIFDF